MSSGMSLNGKEIFESDWLGSIDLGGKDLTVTIQLVEKAEVFNPKTNGKSFKLAFRFKGQQKGMIVNRTNATTISKLYGNEASAWNGKSITLYPTTCKVGRETTTCLRVREKVPGGQKQEPAGAKSEPAKQTPVSTDTSPLTESFAAMKGLWKKRREVNEMSVNPQEWTDFIQSATEGLIAVANVLKPTAFTPEVIQRCLDRINAEMPEPESVEL